MKTHDSKARRKRPTPRSTESRATEKTRRPRRGGDRTESRSRNGASANSTSANGGSTNGGGEPTVPVHLNPELMVRLDGFLERVRTQAPFVHLTRADAILWLLSVGLDAEGAL